MNKINVNLKKKNNIRRRNFLASNENVRVVSTDAMFFLKNVKKEKICQIQTGLKQSSIKTS